MTYSAFPSPAQGNPQVAADTLFTSGAAGDVPASGGGTTNFLRADASFAQVTIANLANIAANSFLGNNTGSPAAPIALTQAQATALLNQFTSSLQGLVPGSGGGTTNFLRADGTWANPVPQPQYTLLNTLTASASATLDDTTSFSTAGYSSFILVFDQIIPATNNVTGELLVHSGGSFQGASYINSTSASFIGMSGASLTSNVAANGGINGRMQVIDPTQAVSPKRWSSLGLSYFNTGTGLPTSFAISAAAWNNTAAVDGFRFQFSSGNITSGTIKVYGIT